MKVFFLCAILLLGLAQARKGKRPSAPEEEVTTAPEEEEATTSAPEEAATEAPDDSNDSDSSVSS